MEAKGKVSIRNFRPRDLSAYVQLVNEIDRVDRLGKATSLEHMKERLGQPGYHPEEDLFFAEQDGVLVGYADISPELEIGRVILDGAVHPHYRHRGVDKRLLESALEQSRAMGAKLVHLALPGQSKDIQRLVQERGFRLVRRHWQMGLKRYRESLHLPQGFQLRHFIPGDEERLCTLQNLAFAGSWGFRPDTVERIRYLVNMSLCHAEGIIFVTEGERVVGYCLAMDDPVEKGKGYIRMMGVDPLYRGQGLGRAVLLAGINYLQRRGMGAIELTVDSRNLVARRLYRSVGFRRKGIILWYQKTLS
ncbi:MAG: GNAT family N-acetyltransferase [Dehalococcoidia bacterium]